IVAEGTAPREFEHFQNASVGCGVGQLHSPPGRVLVAEGIILVVLHGDLEAPILAAVHHRMSLVPEGEVVKVDHQLGHRVLQREPGSLGSHQFVPSGYLKNSSRVALEARRLADAGSLMRSMVMVRRILERSSLSISARKRRSTFVYPLSIGPVQSFTPCSIEISASCKVIRKR